jgi:hypothetical protein
MHQIQGHPVQGHRFQVKGPKWTAPPAPRSCGKGLRSQPSEGAGSGENMATRPGLRRKLRRGRASPLHFDRNSFPSVALWRRTLAIGMPLASGTPPSASSATPCRKQLRCLRLLLHKSRDSSQTARISPPAGCARSVRACPTDAIARSLAKSGRLPSGPRDNTLPLVAAPLPWGKGNPRSDVTSPVARAARNPLPPT